MAVKGAAVKSIAVKSIAAKAAYALTCVLAVAALVVSGKAYQTVRTLDAIGKSRAISRSSPSVSDMNILVMGLESRYDWNDDPLTPDELGPLHAGSETGITTEGVGGHTTNTLILIHIFDGGKKAVGVSIPRDDWVSFAREVNGVPEPVSYDGSSQGKIDQAYGFAWDQQTRALAGQGGLTHDQIAFQAHEAGRRAAIATVEYLTGEHVDHFVEVNLYGFYKLAQIMGGIDVCLNHPVGYDKNSGFYAHHAGRQRLDAARALAFVRQRDGLANGDLDRTHRQQAFMDSVLHQLRTEGVFSDFGKISSLLSAAQAYLISDAGWDLTQFADDMAAFQSGNLTFVTATTLNPDGHLDGQDVNIIDPVAIEQQVQSLFHPGAKPSGTRPADPDPGKTTVQVYNGTSLPTLAAEVSAALVAEGYQRGAIADTPTPQTVTEVLYGTGAQVSATAIAFQLGVTAQPSPLVAAGGVQVLLGPGVNLAAITATPSTSTGASQSPAPTTTTTPTPAPTPQNPAGKPVTVPASGIPCVD